MKYSQDSVEECEIVIGIIGPIGCNREMVIDIIAKLSKHYSYRAETVKMSSLIKDAVGVITPDEDQYGRVVTLMDAGYHLRFETKDNAFLAKLAAVRIHELRKGQHSKRVIYVVDSIKRPEEVNELKNVYGRGFYLFAVHSSEDSRDAYLQNHCNIQDASKREYLIERDKDEKGGHGQSTSDAFHLADFFLTENGNNQKVWHSLERFFDIIFGDPFRTPTFHEYAMFTAYTASIRSADLSRQVGAVVTRGTDIISTGANECPRPGGGSYWPLFDDENNRIFDVEDGRDYKRGHDPNAHEKERIVACLKDGLSPENVEMLEANIQKSGLNDLTEYGRVVHAEMDAILGCARRGVSCKESMLFCTTYPCHNCAKHIISSGIKQVVYVEPYPKSKAYEMHADSIRTDELGDATKILFIPFVGVGPRQFINFFSLSLSVGERIRRKVKGGSEKTVWKRASAKPRVKMYDVSYTQNEKELAEETRKNLEQCSATIRGRMA